MIRLGGLVSQKAFGKFEMGKVISNPYANAFIKEGEGEDHEVSMANNSIDTIIKMATELKAKMGEDEKQIPAWIQDHIAKAENLISQASGNYHEYGDSNESVNEEPAKSTGEKIQNLNNRIKALKDKMAATKSSEQKNLIQQRLKNALQTLSNYKKQNISKENVVNEGVGREAIAIAGFTGTRGIAVQKFIDDFNLNAKKLFNFISKGKLKDRMDFATAISGNPGNKYQGNFVGMFGESTINEDNTPFETLMLIRNLEQTNKLLAQDLKTSKRLPNDKKENIKKSIVVNQGLINYYKETYKNLKNNESVNEEALPKDGSTIKVSNIPVKIEYVSNKKYIGYSWKDKNNKEHYEETKTSDHSNLNSLIKTIKINLAESVNEASPCWKGYKQVGMKDKDGRQVPNCVPNK